MLTCLSVGHQLDIDSGGAGLSPDSPGLAGHQPDGSHGRFTITKTFALDGVSHELTLLPEGHKCRRNHGHNYAVTIAVSAGSLDGVGMVTDFAALVPFRRHLDSSFDHRRLNDVVDFHPTSELLALHLGRWFIENVEPGINGRLVWVRVSETAATAALWERGEAQ